MSTISQEYSKESSSFCHYRVTGLNIPFERIKKEQLRRLEALNFGPLQNTLEITAEILAERELALDLMLFFSDFLEPERASHIGIVYPYKNVLNHSKRMRKELYFPTNEDSNKPPIELAEIACSRLKKLKCKSGQLHETALLFEAISSCKSTFVEYYRAMAS